jgi:hypothetical protein
MSKDIKSGKKHTAGFAALWKTGRVSDWESVENHEG